MLSRLSAVVLLCIFSSWSTADVKIIVHESNSSSLSKGQIKNIYLGKLKDFGNGNQAVPLILPEGSAGFDEFLSKVINKNPDKWRVFWARNVFTGAATPPKEAKDEEMVKLVRENPNLIGVVSEPIDLNGVKVIKEF